MTKQKRIRLFRIVGSACLCAAYFLITSGYVVCGVILNSLAQILLAPFAIEHKAWDLMALSLFFLTCNLRVLLGV